LVLFQSKKEKNIIFGGGVTVNGDIIEQSRAANERE